METLSKLPRASALFASWSVPAILFPAALASYTRARHAFIPGLSILTTDGTHVLDFGYQLVWPAFGLANLLLFLPVSLALNFGTRRKSERARSVTLLSAAILWCLLVTAWISFGVAR